MCRARRLRLLRVGSSRNSLVSQLIARSGLRLVCALGACAGVALVLIPVTDSHARAGAPSCSLRSSTGLRTISLSNQGHTRPFLLYVPRGYRRNHPIPLVFDLHGSGGNGAAQLAQSNVEPLADRQGFAVAAPDGAVPVGTDAYDWNVPGVPLIGGSPVPPGTPNDERYLIAVLQQTRHTICLDAGRVYMTGFSGGARMTSAMACDRSTYFAAFAPVAGLRAGVPIQRQGVWVPDPATCKPTVPVPIVSFHGTADPTNPYDGSSDPRWGYGVVTALQRWAALDHCRGRASSTAVDSITTLIEYRHCTGAASVWLYRTTGAGHVWPGSPLTGSTQSDTSLDATSLIWRFFRAHQR